MKHDVLAVVLACLSCTALPVWAAGDGERPIAEALDADALAEEAKDKGEAAVKLTFEPTQVSINRSISFDEKGKPRHRRNQLNIRLRCFYESAALPLTYGELKIDSVMTSAGETLAVDPNQNNRRNRQQVRENRLHQDRPYFDLNLNLPAPTRSAQAIAEVRGQITMELSLGPERVIRLAPLSKYLGKRFQVTDMDDTPMSLELAVPRNNQPTVVELTHNRKLQSLIREVSFYDARGTVIESRYRGSSTHNNNTAMTQRYGLNPPDNAVMVIKLFRQTQDVVVPFVLRDVPLPVAEPEDLRFDLAVATEPFDRNKPVVAPNGDEGPGRNDLRVIILD